MNGFMTDIVYADQTVSAELLAERAQIFETCSASVKESAYRDCECYADAYLAERKKQPEPRYISVVKNAVTSMCLNLQNIYAYELNECMSNSVSAHISEERRAQNFKICRCKAAFLKENLKNEKIVNHMTVGKLNKAFIAPCRCLVKSPDRNCTHPKLIRGYSVPTEFEK